MGQPVQGLFYPTECLLAAPVPALCLCCWLVPLLLAETRVLSGVGPFQSSTVLQVNVHLLGTLAPTGPSVL